MITPLLLSSVDGEQPGTIVLVQTFRPAVAIWTRIFAASVQVPCRFKACGAGPFRLSVSALNSAVL
jgi:hypothetical protein